MLLRGSQELASRAVTVAVVALALAAPALASNKVTTGATAVSISVVDANAAILSYRAHGSAWTVTATGAINARFPNPRAQQLSFKLVYHQGEGGSGGCRRYDGPPLPWLVAACKGVRGDYWAAQAWPRNLPNYGAPATGVAAEYDLRLSHWRGPLPTLRVGEDWTYRQYDHLYGSLTYMGRPMYGFGTTRPGNPTDRFGVLLYLDTFDPAYGPGWRRENSFVTHKGSGIFCYGFFPHPPHPSGQGKAYRLTVVGPGVLPDLYWQAKAPGLYDSARDAAANAEQRAHFTDKLCHAN